MKKFVLILLALSLFFTGTFTVFAEDASDSPTELTEIPSEIDVSSEPTEIPSETDNSTEPTEVPTETEDATETPTEAEDATEAASDEILTPSISTLWVNCYVNKTLTPLQNRVAYIDGVLYLPAEEIAPLLGLESDIVPFSETVSALRLMYGENSGCFFDNLHYAVINGTALNMQRPAYRVGDALYLPLTIFTDLFGIQYSLDTAVPDPDLYLTSLLDKTSLKYSERVNSLKSDTDYLIWICKADFSLRLFKKSGSNWVLQKEFTCAIGAPSTPTCEGTYKFYERVSRWSYSTYYVGPIMRFNGGYAIHSTLINYDGTPHDNRVGVRISHGCVRLRPDDINYLYKTVPLYTTVYVSAN